VPLDVAQYAEGQRIMAAFVLNTAPDQGKLVPQYLLLLNEPKDGTPQDFNQLRVFTWNARRHHYETAYRERNLEGVLPARAGTASFGKEGTLPTFTVALRNSSGVLEERQYKLNGVMVRRVLASGQEAPRSEHRARRKLR
ncbi:MAG TPA: SH3 domain-containing protein, partial [Terriglobales bacterium]|nr:SH3 domain-containing protein [Terriglobales bacterium]